MAEQRDHILESLKKQTGDAHEATQNRWSNLLLEAQGAIETRQKHFVQVSAAAIEYGCKIAGHLTEAGRGISSNALGIGLQIAQTATNFVRDVEHIRQGMLLTCLSKLPTKMASGEKTKSGGSVGWFGEWWFVGFWFWLWLFWFWFWIWFPWLCFWLIPSCLR
eukprot:gnl/TRDRNA2_/TRDRNA2_162570_c0_seq2.p1 gnl/TRDRNA2_/TRDRNA2_162570_c0~~gnl/TRDRNA2_/TRDRNA2_162570_c0_seq2.p1  ORF type:complete len:163 (+),score=11.36 gnl/TRDRNA2_/TRDRNA2_162570_c0_seq2:510-998(+)